MTLFKKIIRKIYRNSFGNTIKIGNLNLKIGRGHNLPYVLDKYPDYGSNIVRLSNCLYNKKETNYIIDIGANVGDTAAMLLEDNPDYQIVAIEGDPKFYSILVDNFSRNKNVHTYKYFLGENITSINTGIHRSNGTLRLEESSDVNKNQIELITLDYFLDQNEEYKKAKVLKIDTDGYDNRILRGAKNYLVTTKPVLFFEYDTQLLKENNENGIDIFDYLKTCGYKTVLFYDNHGRFIVSLDISLRKTIEQLHRYINDRKGGFAFYDLMIFHAEDNSIAEEFINSEEKN